MSKAKTKLLGEPFSTAQHKLRKSILFSLVQKLELDNCYRCTLKIDTVDELSIEHVESWQLSDKPVELFYDLKNIAFSHLSCNSSAAYRKKTYSSLGERKKAGWDRYYKKNKDSILKRKRQRYQEKNNIRV